MAKGDVVAEHEELVRALYQPLWSSKHGRPASNAFCQTNASVSRTAILPYEEILKIFHVYRASAAPASPVVATCRVFVSQVLEACKAFPEDGVSANVIEDPILEEQPGESDNPAHAEIRAWSSADAGVSTQLSRKMSQFILNVGNISRVVD